VYVWRVGHLRSGQLLANIAHHLPEVVDGDVAVAAVVEHLQRGLSKGEADERRRDCEEEGPTLWERKVGG